VVPVVVVGLAVGAVVDEIVIPGIDYCLLSVTLAAWSPLMMPRISFAFTVRVPEDGWDSLTSLPETNPTIFAEGYRTVPPPPMMVKVPESLSPACCNVPLRVPAPSLGFSKDQSPAHFPVTSTAGGAVGVVAQPETTIIALASSKPSTFRMTLLLSRKGAVAQAEGSLRPTVI